MWRRYPQLFVLWVPYLGHPQILEDVPLEDVPGCWAPTVSLDAYPRTGVRSLCLICSFGRRSSRKDGLLTDTSSHCRVSVPEVAWVSEDV